MFLGISNTTYMPSPFEPILRKSNFFETFVSESEGVSIIANTFIGGGLMLLAMVITWLFIWSYQKDKFLFIAILASVALLFSSEIVILSAVNMSNLDVVQFRLFMGSSLVFSFIFMIVAIFGFIKYSKRGGGSYVPSQVSTYLN